MEGHLSKSIQQLQGVRQGGVLSGDHYKRFNNPLLKQLEQNFECVTTGTTSVPYVTCAADVTLLSKSDTEMNNMVKYVEMYSQEHRYKINPSKSSVIKYNSHKEIENPVLQESKIETVGKKTVHLGVTRNQMVKQISRRRLILEGGHYVL